jgi:hypothetical protein
VANSEPHLASVVVGGAGWRAWGRAAYRQRYTGTLDGVRGEGVASDLSADLTVARASDHERTYQRSTTVRGQRGSMADVPTPQALIRRVTGIGDPPRGR